jgi:holliday junction DNA helicase RuvA
MASFVKESCMISRLKGFLIEKNPPKLLIDVVGIGYEVDAPMTTIYALPELGMEVVLHTHLSVREDAHQLYGFLTLDDRNLFRMLIAVNGIGPKTALGILSALDALSLAEAIYQEDITRLVNIPGIGKKTAERLLIELRDKMAKWAPEAKLSSGKTEGKSIGIKNRLIHEAVQALISLGYKQNDAMQRIEKLQKSQPDLSSEEMIRQALQAMV